VPVTVPVIEPLLAHGDPLNANVPLTELPFWISFPAPVTVANVGDVGALNVPIIQVPLKLGSNGFPLPQPVIKHSAMIPVRLTKAALTVESLAIDLMTILLTFRKRRPPTFAVSHLECLNPSPRAGLSPYRSVASHGGNCSSGGRDSMRESYSFD
jgi:hypothetical protein